MGLLNRKAEYTGQYFGSYESHPKPHKHVTVTLRKKDVRILWGFGGNEHIEWSDIISFDFESGAVSGAYKTTLKTSKGDIVLDQGSVAISRNQGTNQVFSNRVYDNNNKVKRFVISRKLGSV